MTTSARVADVFEIKASYGLESPPGVVVVLENFPSTALESFIGRAVDIRTEAGRRFAARVGATRNHGSTISLFFERLCREDVPIGSSIGFVSDHAPGLSTQEP